MSIAGREIVGPGYSILPTVHERVGGNQSALRPGSQSGGSIQEADCTRAGAEKEVSSAENLGHSMTPGGSTGKAPSTIETVLRRGLAHRWCPPNLSKTQRWRLQKLRKKEIEQGKMEAACDAWFNEARPMKPPKKTWKEKRLA
jgi:hypothetical protein